MSTTATASPPVGTRLAGRLAAGASFVFGVSMFGLVASVNVPTGSSDEKLTAYWRGDEALTGSMLSAAFALLAAICLVVAVNHVLALVGTADARLAAFTRSMATVCAACLVVVGAMRGTIAQLVRTEDLPLPDPHVLRYATSLGYSLLGLGTMGLLGVTMLATAVLILRTRALGKWVGALGCICGAVTLGASVVGFGAFATPVAILWGLGVAVAILKSGPTNHGQFN